jgi:four helix bundle protein
MDLVVEAYRITATLPKNEEFGLKSQIRRAAVSIPSNIAEGQSRNHSREFVQFLHVAMGSLSELETQLEIGVRLELFSSPAFEQVSQHCVEVGKMLNGLASAIRQR